VDRQLIGTYFPPVSYESAKKDWKRERERAGYGRKEMREERRKDHGK
jgi:hypothetical protein